jgi:predicted MFS family arabinose efflux permease
MPSLDLRSPGRLLGRSPDLRLLLGAGLVSMTGDWVLGIGLTYSVYAITGSTLASAVTLLASFIPQVVAGSVAGVFVDRWDRKRTMVACNLLLATGLAPLLLIDTTAQIWVVYVVLVWESLVEVFFAPAEQALLPRLVDDDDLVTANALNSQNQQLSRLVGSALGGVAAATGGIAAVAVLDVVTFVVAAGLVTAIRTSGRATPGSETVPSTDLGAPVSASASGTRGLLRARLWTRLSELGDEWSEGLRAAWTSPVVRVLLVFLLITSTGEGIMGTLFAPYVRDVLLSGAQTLGVITSVQAIGGIVGGFVAASVGNLWSPVRMLGAGAVVFGLIDLAIFLYPLLVVSAWPAIVGMVLVGVPGALAVAGLMTLLQRHTVDAQRGRVFGLVFMVRSIAVVIGTTCAGFLGEAVGIMPVLAFQGVGYVVAGALVLVLLTRGQVLEHQNVTE